MTLEPDGDRRRRAQHPARALVAALALGLATTQAPAGPLDGHPSPYLAAHADDPVRWQVWGEEALADARRTGRPLLVSVGYFACHWCHVMQRESYRDPQVAELLNARFVPVKVDRELEPALDAALVEFSKATRGHAGWPLNVVLTPAGDPLIAVTYLPRDRFTELLEQVDERWRRESETLGEVAARASKILADARRAPPPGPPPDAEAVARLEGGFLAQAAAGADPLRGGFGEGAKFPMPAQLRRLLEMYETREDPTLAEFLVLTLDAMATRGLRDQLGGGFFRYTTDPDWLNPHFEKMLYDSALLAALYLDAAAALEAPRFAAVGRDTLDFMLRSMWDDDRGAFISSLSSVDARDDEGGAYLIDDVTLAEILEPGELAAARVAFDLDDAPRHPGGHLPIAAAAPAEVAEALGIDPERAADLVASARSKLRAWRARQRIPRDEKLLTGWNALALSALARGARLPGGQEYASAASRLRATLLADARQGDRVVRAFGPGAPPEPGALEDYAYLARALLDGAGDGDGESDRQQAAAVARVAWQRFHDGVGWRIGEDPLLRNQPSEAIVPDGALPSASAVLVGATREAALALDDAALMALAERGAGAVPESLRTTPYLYATHIGVLTRMR